ncbi:hypothetical protein TWF281_007033 [Arthrobotrys megalospora]
MTRSIMRFFYLFSAVKLFSGIPFSVALPASELTQSTTSLTKRLNLADLPVIIPKAPPGFYKGDEINQVYFNIDICSVGLYATNRGDTKNPDRWAGWPLGTPDRPYPGENRCINFLDLNMQLVNQVSSYQVAGWCECEFYDGPNCQDSKFRAFNREDDSLGEHGNNDMLESFKCWKEFRPDQFNGCALSYGPSKGAGDLYSLIEQAGPGVDFSQLHGAAFGRFFGKEEIFGDPKTYGSGSCNILDGSVPIETIVTRGCTCVFYTDDACTRQPSEGRFKVGNAGWDRTIAPFESSFKGLKSYTCLPPYGFNWYPTLGDLRSKGPLMDSRFRSVL